MTEARGSSALRACVLLSAALLGLRMQLSARVGFGDAEALYAAYALFPQPGYLDHPGLIGALARVIGNGGAPSPSSAHTATAILATAVPWVGLLAARAAGAAREAAARTALALLLVPEIAVGLFGLTPDLPLALAWLVALGAGALALRSDPRSLRSLLATLVFAAAAGLATLSKVSGGLLLVGFTVAWLARSERARLRTIAPWAALGVFALLLGPWLAWESSQGFPLLQHRLVDSQERAGFSLRNLGALVGGQLLYVTPPFLYGAFVVGRDLWRRRDSDAVSRFLWWSTLGPALPLAVLCLWSRVAEPHWLAPAYLALAVHAARAPALSRGVVRACVGTGAAVVALAFAWVTTDWPLRLLGERYRPRYDLANDLLAWGPGGRLLDDALARATRETLRTAVVVGPHWIVCAQAQAHLGARARVGCNGKRPDDFDRWLPRQRWLEEPVLLFVHDSRFELEPARELPDRMVTQVSRVDVRRSGRVVRTIWVTRLERSTRDAVLPLDTPLPSARWRQRDEAGALQ